MRPTFHHSLVNGKYEDPCLYVRMLRERRSFLFDLGNISRLGPGDLQKVTDVFVTHMHIDHFIGFDSLLRALLWREAPLRIYGPEEIIECIEGKLHGYTWNLINQYPTKIEVMAISRETVRHASFYAKEGFKRIVRPAVQHKGSILEEPMFRVNAACLTHGIPCLGFSLEEDFHINIDRDMLNKKLLPVGPWLKEFKRLIREKAGMDAMLNAGGRHMKLSELSGIARITSGQKISYLADISPEKDNIETAIDLVKGSDTLYCEAYFLQQDEGRAFDRHHLTAKAAGDLARKAEVKKLVVMHFSPRYLRCAEELEAEAARSFSG